MIRRALKAITVLCLLSSLAACSEESPDRPDRGQRVTETRESSAAITTPEGDATQAPTSAERTVIESTVGGAILRRDEGVLRVDRAELLRSRDGDEIFVRATVKGSAQARDCYLMKASTWFALRDAIESEDVSDAPAMPEATWADPAATTKFSGGDTLAVSFQEDTNRVVEGPDPRDTAFFAVCYKFASIDGPGATWYDVAHVEGSPQAP